MRNTDLRHRITIQSKTPIEDPDTGYQTFAWVDRVVNEPARYLPGPGREYLASEALRSQVTGRFFMRWSAETIAITAGDRLLWDGRVFSVKSPATVDETGRREVTLMVQEDSSDGS